MTPLLEAAFSAGYAEHVVLEDVRFELMPGEILGLAGGSGSGKSTLIMALIGLIGLRGGFVRGKLIFAGQDLLKLKMSELRLMLGCKLALIPPSPHSALNPRLTLLRHFHEAWRAHRKGEWEAGLTAVSDRLASVDLPTDRRFLNKLPGEISTGQAQRILIAIALLHRPQLLLADEPTSALDTVTQAGLLNLLRQINQQEGTGILFVSHDLLAAASLCHRLAILSEGHIVETIATSRLAEDAKHPATLALLNALPSIPDGLLDMQRRVSAARSSSANYR